MPIRYAEIADGLRSETDPEVLAQCARSAQRSAARCASELAAGTGNRIRARLELAQNRTLACVIAANPNTAPDVVAGLVAPVAITHHDKPTRREVNVAAVAVAAHWPAEIIDALYAVAARNLDVDWDAALAYAEGLTAPQH